MFHNYSYEREETASLTAGKALTEIGLRDYLFFLRDSGLLEGGDPVGGLLQVSMKQALTIFTSQEFGANWESTDESEEAGLEAALKEAVGRVKACEAKVFAQKIKIKKMIRIISRTKRDAENPSREELEVQLEAMLQTLGTVNPTPTAL